MPTGIAVPTLRSAVGGDPVRDVMIVVQKGDHSLGYYDFANGTELGRTTVDPFPHEFVLSADRQFAYSCHFGVALAEDEGPRVCSAVHTKLLAVHIELLATMLHRQKLMAVAAAWHPDSGPTLEMTGSCILRS
jgi:hypothetical protein